jgi:hypothetical protein
VQSRKIQVSIVVGLAVVLAVLDWVINDTPRLAIVVAAALLVGLVVRYARRKGDSTLP